MTVNNPEETLEVFMAKLSNHGAVYARAQLEKGDNGTPHFQACVGYARDRRITAMIKLFPGTHVEHSKNALAAWRYCGKEDSREEGPLEFGVPPAAKNVKGDTKARNAMILEYGVVKSVDEGLIPLEKLK